MLAFALSTLLLGPTSQDTLNAWLKGQFKDLAASLPLAVPLNCPELKTIQPGVEAFRLNFQKYPMQRQPVAPLGPNNIMLVNKAGKVAMLNSLDAMRYWLGKAVQNIPSSRLPVATKLALQLTQELVTDGMFAFSPGEIKVKAEGNKKRFTLRSPVKPKGGDSGWVEVSLVFEPVGKNWKLYTFDRGHLLTPGVRPICQATKLLDPDPIVRRMAEQDILIMGRACKPYLDWIRAQSKPELQNAIDAIWQRILERDRG
jgi:hypothetical protein